MTATRDSYEAKDITVLEGLEAVKRRPGMYIGSTGPRGLHHLIWEVVDNSVDEAMAGQASRIEVTLLADGGVEVVDDGRGIPVEQMSKTKRSALTTVLTTLHAGGKFEQGAYTVSGGLHGVGVSVVNALSTRLEAEVRRGGHVYYQEFSDGQPKTKDPEEAQADQEDGHHHSLLAEPGDIPGDHRVRLRHGCLPIAGDRIPEPRPSDHSHRPAQRSRAHRGLPLQGWAGRLRQASQLAS